MVMRVGNRVMVLGDWAMNMTWDRGDCFGV